MNLPNAKQDATRVTLVGMWLDLLRGIGKIVGGICWQMTISKGWICIIWSTA